MNPEQEKARQSAEAEMKIYTPHRVIQEKCDNVAFANAAGIIHRLRNQPAVVSFRLLFMSHLKGARRVCLVLGCQHKLTGGLL